MPGVVASLVLNGGLWFESITRRKVTGQVSNLHSLKQGDNFCSTQTCNCLRTSNVGKGAL